MQYYDKRAKTTVSVPFDKNTKLIANCAPVALDKMLGLAKPSIPRLQKLKYGCSLFTIYLIFDCDLKTEFPDIGYHTYMYPSVALKDMAYYKSELFQRPITFLNRARVDGGLGEHSCGEMTTAGYLREWENLSKEEYKEQKDKLVEHYL